MKKLLWIVVLGLFLISSNADAGFFKDFFSGTKSTGGCAYDSLGEKIECVSIEYGGEGGLTWDEATNRCVSYLKRFVNLDEGTIEGCI